MITFNEKQSINRVKNGNDNHGHQVTVGSSK